VNVKFAGLVGGMVFGYVMSWARLTDPAVIYDMLLLREAHVFLIMGSAIVVAAGGVHLLRAVRVKCFSTGEPVRWAIHSPERRHVIGSVIFGAGWSVAGTCPGPVAAMIGEGRLAGLVVGAGLLAGVALQPVLTRKRPVERPSAELSSAVGL
jgi:uncharacterized membrane protein YedE/YeeE